MLTAFFPKVVTGYIVKCINCDSIFMYYQREKGRDFFSHSRSEEVF